MKESRPLIFPPRVRMAATSRLWPSRQLGRQGHRRSALCDAFFSMHSIRESHLLLFAGGRFPVIVSRNSRHPFRDGRSSRSLRREESY